MISSPSSTEGSAKVGLCFYEGGYVGGQCSHLAHCRRHRHRFIDVGTGVYHPPAEFGKGLGRLADSLMG